MYSFVTKNKLIYEKQFGFRSNYSTNHALISLTENLNKYIHSSHFVALNYELKLASQWMKLNKLTK